MVSLSLMARLVEAVRPQARLVLVGDPGQLTSIRRARCSATSSDPRRTRRASSCSTGVHRFGGAIATLAEAIRRGDADATIDALYGTPDEVTWLLVNPIARRARPGPRRRRRRRPGRDRGRPQRRRAQRARGLASFRVLCAHRRGPYGVETWTDRIEAGSRRGRGLRRRGPVVVGRPLLVTENDYGLRLCNGDTGVVVATAQGRVSAAFERRGEVIEFSPSRLSAVDRRLRDDRPEPGLAVRRCRGPAARPDVAHPHARAAYTAVTRARERLILAGTEEAVRAAMSRPVARASGLRWRLWEATPGTDSSG